MSLYPGYEAPERRSGGPRWGLLLGFLIAVGIGVGALWAVLYPDSLCHEIEARTSWRACEMMKKLHGDMSAPEPSAHAPMPAAPTPPAPPPPPPPPPPVVAPPPVPPIPPVPAVPAVPATPPAVDDTPEAAPPAAPPKAPSAPATPAVSAPKPAAVTKACSPYTVTFLTDKTTLTKDEFDALRAQAPEMKDCVPHIVISAPSDSETDTPEAKANAEQREKTVRNHLNRLKLDWQNATFES